MGFWANVEKELEYKGISRKELAFRANIAYQGIGLGIERDSMPRADTAFKISKVLDVPLEYLLDKNDIEIKPEIKDLYNSSKKIKSSTYDEKQRAVSLYNKHQKLLESLEKIPPEIKEPIIAMILRLADSF